MGISNEIGVELHETAPFPANINTDAFAGVPVEDYEIGEDVVVIKL